MERTPNKCQHTKLTLGKKILPPLLPGFELATFRSRVRRSYQQAIPAPQIRVSALSTTKRVSISVPDARCFSLARKELTHLTRAAIAVRVITSAMEHTLPTSHARKRPGWTKGARLREREKY